MCGVNTIFRKDAKPVDIGDITKMCAAIEHRGPDGAGFALLDRGNVALGHVRLSIIDLHAGDQPLYNEDGSVCIVFNGEIYDYKELREELIAQGHSFRTNSDTEVIVHLYEQHGLSFVDRLNGEFAFIIWDSRERKLIAARDRVGVKPLFFHENANEILISSEIKGILALARIPRAINPDYMVGPMFGAFPRSQSAIQGMQSVRPGHFLILEPGKDPVHKPYWKPSFNVDHKMTFEDARDTTRDLVTKAVKRRMVADVPVGSYLSAGLDSTLVTGLMSDYNSQVKAFNVGFKNTIYDEAEPARQVARHFGAGFQTIDCNDDVLAGDMMKTLYHCEQPLANPVCIAKEVLSKMVRGAGYKVCLTGEGADEVFGGYPFFKMEKIWRMIQAGGDEAAKGHALWKKFCKMETRSEGLLWQRGLNWKGIEPLFGYPSFHQVRATENKKFMHRLLRPEVIEASKYKFPLEAFVKEYPGEAGVQHDPFNTAKLISFNQLTSYIIPTHGDRVEMANSIECRTPFLDKDLYEFASTVPPEHHLKIDELKEKHLLRQAFFEKLPPVMKNTHKHPFLAPSWYRLKKTEEGGQMYSEFMSKDRVSEFGLFNYRNVRRLKFFWSVLPKSSTLWKRVDVLMGLIWTAQSLHYIFVENSIMVDQNFEIKDRSWNAKKVGSPDLAVL